MIKHREILLVDLKTKFELDVREDGLIIDSLNLCNRNSDFASILTYITDASFIPFLEKSNKIKCVFVSHNVFDEIKESIKSKIVFIKTENPEFDFYKFHEFLINETAFYENKDFKSRLGANLKIAKSAVIENGVIIGDNVVIDSNTVIKSGAIIGKGTRIGCNCTIGSDGFQVIYDPSGLPFLVTHVGGVKIGDDVKIGDNSTISRSLFEGFTEIKSKVMIDSHVHIGHNCYIGEGAVLTAGVTLLGSVKIENNVWIAPSSTIMNKVILEKFSVVGIGSVVVSNVEQNTKVLGVPARKTHF